MSLTVIGIVIVGALAAIIVVLKGRRTAPFDSSGKTWTRAESSDSDAVSDASRLRTALDEIAFDRSSGKLSVADYEALRASYTAALEKASAAAAVPAIETPDEAELLVSRARAEQGVCPACGPRPEASPPYCSSCGRHLRACRECGERPPQIGARFCSHCGHRLAA